MRKTVDRQVLIDCANRQLAASETKYPRLNRAYREGIAAIVGEVLHHSGSYCGFRYLDADQLEDSTEKPGIRRHEDKSVDFPDESRINFI